MNTTEKELKSINEQIVATILFLGTIIVSLSLSIDKRQKILNKKAIYSNEKARNIAIINRIIVVFIVLIYLQIDKENLDITKEKQNQTNLANLQIIAELITLIAALIALYITYNSKTEDISIENPEI